MNETINMLGFIPVVSVVIAACEAYEAAKSRLTKDKKHEEKGAEK